MTNRLKNEANVRRAMQKQAIYFLSAACLTFGLHAADDQNEYGQYNSQQRVRPHHKEVKVTQKQRTDKCMNYYGYGAFTYWNGQVNDLTFLPVVELGDGQTVQHLIYQAKTRPGFKVGAGYYCNTNQFDTNVEYTWFYNEQDKGEDKIALTTLTGDSTYLGKFKSAGGTLANNFNRLDFTLNKLIFFHETFRITTGGGIVGSWSEFWENVLAKDNTESQPDSRIYVNNKIWGAGPYARVMSSFILPISAIPSWSHICLYMSAGTGFNWMNSKVSIQSTEPGGMLTFNFRDSLNNMRQLLDGRIGLRWEMMSNEYPVNAFVDIGWQVQNWGNLYRADYVTPLGLYTTSHDYFMQGLTATVGIDF